MHCCGHGCSRLVVLTMRQVSGTVTMVTPSRIAPQIYTLHLHTLPRNHVQGYMKADKAGGRTYCCLSEIPLRKPVFINSYSKYLWLRMITNDRNNETYTPADETLLDKDESSIKVSHLSSTAQENADLKDTDKLSNDKIHTNELKVHVKECSDLDSKVSWPGEITEGEGGEIIQAEPLPPRYIVKPVFNLAALVNKSEPLSNFVKLGVDLSVIEKDREAANLMIHLNFEKDVQPLLLFLHDLGIDEANFGPMLTRYPMILQHSKAELQAQVNYLKSKNFTDDSVARIVCKSPMLFSLSVQDIDSTLGVYQRTFKLTGDEIRHVFTRLPKLFTWNSAKVKDVKFYMNDFLGFSLAEIKQIFITQPKVLLSDKHQLGKRFDYLYNEMKLSHYALVTWPQIFRTRVRVFQERHLYLKHLGRAQYDPEKENYVALRTLVSGKDRDFCFQVAKTSVAQYNDFLKTL